MPKKNKAPKKRPIHRLSHAIEAYEYVYTKGTEVCFYHQQTPGGSWWCYRIHGMGIEYKHIEASEIPLSANCVMPGFFKRETKQIHQLMMEKIEYARTLEETVKKAEKE